MNLDKINRIDGIINPVNPVNLKSAALSTNPTQLPVAPASRPVGARMRGLGVIVCGEKQGLHRS